MTEAGQTLIQIEDMTKTFFTDEVETHALSGIHLTIRKGDPRDAARPRCSQSSACSTRQLPEGIG
jgi:hypothetical protein